MKVPNLSNRSIGSSNSNKQNICCFHCAGPLSKQMEASNWTIPPSIRVSFSMIGSGVGGTTSAFYGFNQVMRVVHRWVKGPMWLHFLVGTPLVLVLISSACAGLAGGVVPALAQLVSSSYHAAMSSPPSEDDEIQKSRTSSTI
ncbi:PREDICTED: uncharacterized protein LOC109354172 [Lupinus angustifolius]|uniref:uncharacterized protein LOC109354172 n=1 Tax=Lupinus angustifolius TaxID=3871 RepID=UPI00092FD65D|nr:PREDICTED: uncharacterized protein LOC109354172 [Lupinus angustifolius]